MRIWVLSSFFSKTIFGCGNLSPAANRISAGIRRCRRLDLDRRFIGFSHIYLCLFIQMVSISFIWFYSIRFRMGFLLSSFESSAGGAVSWRVGGLQFIVAIPIKFNCCNAIVSAHQCPPVRTHTHTRWTISSSRPRRRHCRQCHITICSTYFSRISSCRSCADGRCASRTAHFGISTMWRARHTPNLKSKKTKEKAGEKTKNQKRNFAGWSTVATAAHRWIARRKRYRMSEMAALFVSLA